MVGGSSGKTLHHYLGMNANKDSTEKLNVLWILSGIDLAIIGGKQIFLYTS